MSAYSIFPASRDDAPSPHEAAPGQPGPSWTVNTPESAANPATTGPGRLATMVRAVSREVAFWRLGRTFNHARSGS